MMYRFWKTDKVDLLKILKIVGNNLFQICFAYINYCWHLKLSFIALRYQNNIRPNIKKFDH